ncbi:unnamed protein product [Triticum turgidum subsp. durum]|uniref:Uncharacterized protein n=1 Tax=Triticum turgidum subsp. durum TaxID=4567 RepID=A0A9R1Q4P5_TRITD|nr:unnamed protein product [Triticum turgidum subsp. durum]
MGDVTSRRPPSSYAPTIAASCSWSARLVSCRTASGASWLIPPSPSPVITWCPTSASFTRPATSRVTRAFEIKAVTCLHKVFIKRTAKAVLAYGAIPRQRYSEEAWMQHRFLREQVKSAALQAYMSSRVGIHLLDIEAVMHEGDPSSAPPLRVTSRRLGLLLNSLQRFMAHTTVTFIGNHVVSDQCLLRETYRLRVTRVFDIKAATGLRKASIERTPEAVLGYGAIPRQRYSKEAWMQLRFPREQVKSAVL